MKLITAIVAAVLIAAIASARSPDRPITLWGDGKHDDTFALITGPPSRTSAPIASPHADSSANARSSTAAIPASPSSPA